MCSLYEATVFNLEAQIWYEGLFLPGVGHGGISFLSSAGKGAEKAIQALCAVLGTRRPPRKNISQQSFLWTPLDGEGESSDLAFKAV